MPGRRIGVLLAVIAVVVVLLPASAVTATPVCTDGYEGGPPLSACGGRVFPEVENAVDYVQYLPDPATGFREYQHGLEYLAQAYPRWVSVFTLTEYSGDEDAVTAGPDGIRSTDEDDSGDGYEILVVKLTDHEVPDEGKQNLVFSLSVHGDERGGLEGGVRAVEDLAMKAEDGGTIVDGIDNYESTTGVAPEFHEHEVADILAQEAVYFVDFNIDGWATGERNNLESTVPLYQRGNHMGTDLNRQMPTIGRIHPNRNPLEESEMRFGHALMHDLADAGVDGRLAYGADIHGESQSRAFVDVMYPAGQFDSIKHRQLMAIAERTKSLIDARLFDGLVDLVESNTGGNAGEGLEEVAPGVPKNTVPTKPAHWATVWDTLGYTDTGFIGDYMASELGVTGMDYEIAFNHSDFRAFGRPWSVVLQENYVEASRAIIETAMAYTLYQDEEFADFSVDPQGQVGYVYNPDTVTDTDENGPGRLPGPGADGIGADGQPVEQRPYEATNMAFFEDEAPVVAGGFQRLLPADIAADPAALDAVDTLVLADIIAPEDAEGRTYDTTAYLANINTWIERGGNLVLTDKAVHALADLGVVDAEAIADIGTYMPYANFVDREHDLAKGLRGNARQLVEAAVLGYEIGDDAPMTVVDTAAWEDAGGHVVATTGDAEGDSDDGTQTSVGEVAVGEGKIRIIGGALPTPTEENDHRYGLKDYGVTYSALFVLENSFVHDAPSLGADAGGSETTGTPGASAGRAETTPAADNAADRAKERAPAHNGGAPANTGNTTQAATTPATASPGGPDAALLVLALAAFALLGVRRMRRAHVGGAR